MYWLKQAQLKHHPGVFKILRKQVQPLQSDPNTKLIADLGLYLEEGSDVVRSHGRIQHANLPAGTKFPVLLPSNSKISELIILATHMWNKHSGVQDTLIAIRQWCWLPKGRQQVKTILSRCKLCQRYDGPPFLNPGPPILPEERVAHTRPFLNTGVDYTGAIQIRGTSGSGDFDKVYICLFTCMVTRNIHLEVAVDLSAQTFLDLLRRFVANCSLPQLMISDHGTNLSATAKFLEEIYNQELVRNYLTEHQITWKFIHVRSPWEGGFYERLIGVTKSCLRKILYRKILTLQELITVVAEVKARVNNHPLTYVSNEQQKLQSLTPAHLMYGRRILTMPPLILEDDRDSTYGIDAKLLNKSFTHISKLLRKFEEVFEKDYLVALRERHNGNKPPNNNTLLKVGDVVLVEMPADRERSPLGKILKLYPDPDGIVRSVLVYSKGIESVRTVGKLVHMESNESTLPLHQGDEQMQEVPEDPVPEVQRPRRAADKEAIRRNRQLFQEDLA